MDRIVVVALCVLCFVAVFANPARRASRSVATSPAIASHPYVLQHWTSGSFNGVAAAVGPNHAISAAHKFNEPDPNKHLLLGGSATINGSDGIAFAVEKIILHPSFDAATKNFDIAVVRVVESFLGLPNVAFIPVQTTFVSSTPTIDCTVVGWGSTENGAQSESLYAVPMQIRPQVDCVDKWSDYRSITAQMFCAQSDSSDVCRGDSGGSLVCTGRLAGLVSWDADNCTERGRTFFTRLANYEIRKFIRSHAGV